MAAFRFTPAAERDLEELIGYIAADNAVAAQRLYQEIWDRCGMLARMQELGRSREELGKDLRSFLVAPAIIYYRPGPEGIEVIRVLHAARDANAAF